MQVYNSLSIDDKQSVLIALGCPPGQTSQVCSKGPGEWIATVSHFGGWENKDIWARFPTAARELYGTSIAASMDQLSQKDRASVAEAIASDWYAICSHLNIEPAYITSNLYAGATPLDCARFLVQRAASRCMPLSVFRAAALRYVNLRGVTCLNADTPTSTYTGAVDQQQQAMGAREFLSRNFPPHGVGHTQLNAAACSTYDTFVAAFRFTPSQCSGAAASTNNRRALVDCLLEKFYASAATVSDLRVALERWNHVKLLNNLGLSSDSFTPVQVRATQSAMQNDLLNNLGLSSGAPASVQARETTHSAMQNDVTSAVMAIDDEEHVVTMREIVRVPGHKTVAKLIAALDNKDA